jgi:hypothetical protein
LPGTDDNDLERRLREEPVEADEETTPAEARWFLNAALALALVAVVAAVAGVGTVSNGLRSDVLGVLEKARDSSTAALDSSTGALRSVVGASVGQLGAVASKVGAVPSALGGDVVGALQQARDSSTAALRSAVGESPGKRFQNGSNEPFRKQYGSNVFLCLPNVNNVYVTRSVSARSVPSLVSGGAIYPVPAGGCS